MKKMAEYINKKVLKNRFVRRLNWLEKDVYDCYTQALYDDCKVCLNLIDEIPTIDDIPVVRCKNCKYFANAIVNSNGFLICHVNGMEITPKDFCSYGERKNGADNG